MVHLFKELMAWRTGGHHFSLDLRLETGQRLSSWSPASKPSFVSACKGSLLPCDSGSFGSLEGLTGLNMSARNVGQCRDLQAGWPAAGPLRAGFVPSILPAASWRPGVRGGARGAQSMRREENRSEASSPGRTPISHPSGQREHLASG